MGDTHAGRALLIGSALLLGTTTAARADVAFSDIWSGVLTQCIGCHGADQDGQMRFNTPQTFRSVAVNIASRSSNSGKLRVHPYAPELSFLVDKLRGHVKANEGDPMLRGGPGLVYSAPGHVAAVEEWIRAGAPACDTTQPKGSNACPTFLEGLLEKGHPQPAFEPLAPEGATIELASESFTVSHLSNAQTITREGQHTSEVLAGNGAATMVTGISIQASAGTEWIALYRGEDEAPLAVARGESLELALPEGVGIPIDADQSFRIVQHVRNDYFLNPGAEGNPEPAGVYHNATTGEAIVYLTTDDSASTPATPFADTTGSDLLFVSPKQVGVTGGAWASPGAAGAIVGLWTDRRAIAAALVDPAGQAALTETGQAEDEPELRAGYVEASGSGGVAYSCVHNNGASNAPRPDLAFATTLATTLTSNNETLAPYYRPVRSACAADANTPAGVPAVVADALGMDGGQSCWRDHDPSPWPPATTFSFGNDCESSEQCRQANLVAGPSFEDGRCTLVGLWW